MSKEHTLLTQRCTQNKMKRFYYAFTKSFQVKLSPLNLIKNLLTNLVLSYPVDSFCSVFPVSSLNTYCLNILLLRCWVRWDQLVTSGGRPLLNLGCGQGGQTFLTFRDIIFITVFYISRGSKLEYVEIRGKYLPIGDTTMDCLGKLRLREQFNHLFTEMRA